LTDEEDKYLESWQEKYKEMAGTSTSTGNESSTTTSTPSSFSSTSTSFASRQRSLYSRLSKGNSSSSSSSLIGPVNTVELSKMSEEEKDIYAKHLDSLQIVVNLDEDDFKDTTNQLFLG
jgi:hypothetical protein